VRIAGIKGIQQGLTASRAIQKANFWRSRNKKRVWRLLRHTLRIALGHKAVKCLRNAGELKIDPGISLQYSAASLEIT